MVEYLRTTSLRIFHRMWQWKIRLW